MRLPDDIAQRALALGLTFALAGCGLLGGGDRPMAVSDSSAVTTAANDQAGPAGDYPVVIGAPFTVDGIEYTPADTLNYDEVGFAAFDPSAGAGVTAASKTLPLPSYVEVTSLATGKTILARVERRGPMTSQRLIALSPAAIAQLGVGDGAPVRVRRVNPPEVDRAELRAGRVVPLRMDTPETLLGVLRRKLPTSGSVSLASAQRPPVPSSSIEGATSAPVRTAAAIGVPVPTASRPAPSTRAASGAYPLRPLDGSARAAPVAIRAAASAPRSTVPQQAGVGDWVVQAAAFSSKANAERAATHLGGYVTQAGRFYRVRTGPYTTRGQAEAALAKVHAAGYSDAKVFTAG